VVEAGAVIKADVGCLIGGYSSDMARTYAFGRPEPLARDIFAALADAFETGFATIRPGVALRDVHAATLAAMNASGYLGYRRGHFGHGLGASVGSEEWPFIAADSDAVAEPGMMLAFETPFYGKGVGALMIEDQLLVTETGIERISQLPRGLVELG
jgi:Xaa-Pro dipeptidase